LPLSCDELAALAAFVAFAAVSAAPADGTLPSLLSFTCLPVIVSFLSLLLGRGDPG
jgi:hypothetical protein